MTKKFYPTLLAKMVAFSALLSLPMLSAKAQNNVLKINPLALVGADLDLSLERATSAKTSFVLGGYVGTAKPEDIQHFNLGVLAEYRYYFSVGNLQSEATRGLYVAPFARFRHGQAKGGHLSFTNLGINGGYQWVIKEKFSIEAFAGPYYNLILSEKGEFNTDAVRYYGKTSMRFGMSVGYRF